MSWLVFIRGLLLGLAYVAPVGVQNLFVVNSSVGAAWRRALGVAWCVVLFDVALGLACFLGMGALLEAWPVVRVGVLLVGAALLLWIAVSLWRTPPAEPGAGRTAESSWLKVLAAACIVTWANPQAIIDGTLVLGASQAALPQGTALAFIAGFTCASFLWFTTLASVVSLAGRRLSTRALTLINRACAAYILLYALHLLTTLIG